LKLGLFRFWPTADGKWLCSAHAQLPGQEYYFLMRLRKAGGEPVYRGTHHAEEPVPLEPGEYTLDAAMYSDTTHELGGARTTIEVPEMPKGAYIGDAMPVRGKGGRRFRLIASKTRCGCRNSGCCRLPMAPSRSTNSSRSF
jgi:hypothetical protein